MNDDRAVSPRRKRAPVPLKRSACTCAPRGSARPCSPGQGRPQFPHLRQHLLGRRSCNSDSCRPAAPSDRTAAIFVAISLPPRRIRAFRYPAATGATRSTTNALPTRLRIFSISSDVSTRGALHALSPRLSSIHLYRTEYTRNTRVTRACMRVCPHIARGRAKRRGGSVSATAYNCGRGKVIRTRKGRSLQLCCFFFNRDIREAIAR